MPRRPDAKTLRRIRLLIMDVDGVLTDGSIRLLDDGSEVKRFHAHDGSAIVFLHRVGLQSALLTGRRSRATRRRAKDLGIRILEEGNPDKREGLARILRKAGCDASEACHMGDDLTDVPVMRRVGLAVAVRDAAPEAKRAAAYVTKRPGGHGAVREVVEMILRAQGLWPRILRQYEAR
ncbi:MAG: HAD hydrolase family protein [Planctomycetota bacterium]